jgi:hypothetical protein
MELFSRQLRIRPHLYPLINKNERRVTKFVGGGPEMASRKFAASLDRAGQNPGLIAGSLRCR